MVPASGTRILEANQLKDRCFAYKLIGTAPVKDYVGEVVLTPNASGGTDIRAAQLSLGLDPSTRSGPDSSDGVRRILGAVTTIANGLAELRNRGLGTGHGPATARVGLGSRHAHLAVNAALTWCQLMLDTLADPDAPWRTGQS